jgi:hypothetical protein
MSAPQPVNTPITFTASVIDGSGDYESRWYLWNGVTWILLRGWAPDVTFAWTPGQANAAFVIAVHVRNAGEVWVSSSQRGLPFPITAGP